MPVNLSRKTSFNLGEETKPPPRKKRENTDKCDGEN